MAPRERSWQTRRQPEFGLCEPRRAFSSSAPFRAAPLARPHASPLTVHFLPDLAFLAFAGGPSRLARFEVALSLKSRGRRTGKARLGRRWPLAVVTSAAWSGGRRFGEAAADAGVIEVRIGIGVTTYQLVIGDEEDISTVSGHAGQSGGVRVRATSEHGKRAVTPKIDVGPTVGVVRQKRVVGLEDDSAPVIAREFVDPGGPEDSIDASNS